MSHITILISSVSPSASTAGMAAAGISNPEFRVDVTYTPPDSATPSQIGNEVARIQRRVNQIIEGTPD